jgi:hypothetical protein
MIRARPRPPVPLVRTAQRDRRSRRV